MDVTGDGRDEIFLTSSLASFGYHADWEVFSVADDGGLQPYTSRLSFASGNVFRRIQGDKIELIYGAPPDMESQMGVSSELLLRSVHRHSFDYPNIRSVTRSMDSSELARFKEGVEIDRPVLEVVLLSDYILGVRVDWRAVTEWKVNSFNYFRLPDDATRIGSDSRFTPQFALEQLQAKRGATDKVDRGSEVGSADVAVVPEREIEDGAKGLPTGKYALIAVLLLLGIAMFRVFSRRRKAD